MVSYHSSISIKVVMQTTSNSQPLSPTAHVYTGVVASLPGHWEWDCECSHTQDVWVQHL